MTTDLSDNITLSYRKHGDRVRKLKALASNPGTPGEGIAAEAALDRIEPDWRISDEQLLADLGVKI